MDPYAPYDLWTNDWSLTEFEGKQRPTALFDFFRLPPLPERMVGEDVKINSIEREVLAVVSYGQKVGVVVRL